MNYPRNMFHPSWRKLVMSACAVSLALIFSTTFVYAVGLFEVVDPLPNGCIRPTPPGEEAPLCCLNGFVSIVGTVVKDAEVTIFDAQGFVGKAGTKRYPGKEERPYYYVDLTKLTRPITPTDVITLQVSYHGITQPPVAYTVRPGGQQFHFNLYQTDTLPLIDAQPGVAEIGKFQNISSVAVDSQGDLYLWDPQIFRMGVLRPTGDGAWVDRSRWQREIGTQPHQVRGAARIAIDGQRERVYLADPYKTEIAIYTTDGDFTGKSIPAPSNIWSIAVDGAGNVYVITLFDGLYKFSPDGHALKHITEEALVQLIGKKPNETPVDRRIAVSTQGELFVARYVPNGVFKFTSDLAPLPFSVGALVEPSAILVDDENVLFVFDHATFQLRAFDTDGNQLAHVWPVPPFSRGSGIYLAVSGNHIYLVSGYDGKIVQYARQGGGPLKTWGGFVANHGSIGLPSDIVVAPDRSIIFPDPWSGHINQMVDNQIVQSWPVLGQPGGYTSAALTLDHNGKLLATVNGDYLQQFRIEDATLITETQLWGGRGASLGQLCSPSALATDKNGFVYVAEPCNHRIQVLRQDLSAGGFVTVTSTTAIIGAEVLTQPFGIAVDDRSTPTKIYVTDLTHSHIVKLSFDGTQLRLEGTIGSFGAGAGQLFYPRHLDIAEDGTLWVADDYYRVHHIDPNDPANWHTYGSNNDPVWSAHGIAIAKSANQKERIYVSSWSFGLISSFKIMEESDPIATITHCSAEDLVPGETLTCSGAGQDGDATNIIAAYEWTTVDGLVIATANPQVVIPTIGSATTPSALGPGLHTLQLRVQDNEGIWSQPVTRLIFVDVNVPEPTPTALPTPDSATLPAPPTACPTGYLWTMLLYLDADYKNDGIALLADFRRVLNELKTLNHACAQVAVQIDGPASIGNPGAGDTERWLIRFNPNGTQPLSTTVPIGEQKMDLPETLSNFLKWGQGELPADHYYLAIANHGNAFQGIAFDHTSDPTGSAYLSATGLRTALNDPDVLPIDIVHLDACSMALLDVAYDVRSDTKVNYLIASQYIGWSYFAYPDYAHYITQWTDAEQLATSIVDRYAHLAEQNKLPYTIAALDLTRVGPLKNGISQLALYLKAWLNADTAAGERHHRLFTLLRNQSQFFDSNSNYLNTPRDAYIDLKDFVLRLQQAALTEDLTTTATDVLHEFGRTDALVLHKRHSFNAHLPAHYANGALIGIAQANGVSLYYPAEGDDLLALPVDPTATPLAAATTPLSYTKAYADYLNDKLFDFSDDAGWDQFLQAAYGPPPTDPSQLASAPNPLRPASVPRKALYLPIVIKK